MGCVSGWMRCAVLGLVVGAAGYLGTSMMTPARAADSTTQPKKDHKAAASQPIKLGEDFDKLGLNNDQKTQIAALRKELKVEQTKLQTDEKAKEMAILTPDQQATLKTLEEERQKAKDAKAKGGTTTPATQKDSK